MTTSTDPSGTTPIGANYGLRSRLRASSRPRRASGRSDLLQAGAFVLLAGALLAWAFGGNDYNLQLGIDVLMFVTLAYSWNVISGFAGYVSFGQVVFFGLGALSTALMIIHLEWSWYVAAAASGVVAGLVAIPVGLIMLRLRGIYFALGMAGLVYITALLSTQSDALGGSTGLLVPGELAQGQLLVGGLVVATAAFALNWYLTRSKLGLQAMAIRDDEDVAAAMGVRTMRIKVTAFALSAVLPAVFGGISAYNRSFIESSTVFSPTMELQTLLFVIAGGIGTLWGPMIGSVLLTFVNNAVTASLPEYQLGLFGLLTVLIVILLPGGIVSLGNRLGWLCRVIVKAPAELPPEKELFDKLYGDESAQVDKPKSDELLVCRDVGVSFGGVHALTGVDFTVRRGETVCIIGANGAGKTTLFNAITGMVRPSSGEIVFDGSSSVGSSPQALARRGLGRTFQIPRPFESMTVWENILVAAMGGRQSAHAVDQAAWVVRVLHLEDIWLDPVVSLPVGHRRMVELGRALALQPEIILLDEVMAGMSHAELERVRETIRRMPSFGVGAVAGIEHVITAIIDLADRIVVLDEGRMILEGPPEEILRHPEVIRAYLGEAMI